MPRDVTDNEGGEKGGGEDECKEEEIENEKEKLKGLKFINLYIYC